jgi:hypothetical protein
VDTILDDAVPNAIALFDLAVDSSAVREEQSGGWLVPRLVVMVPRRRFRSTEGCGSRWDLMQRVRCHGERVGPIAVLDGILTKSARKFYPGLARERS